jgi:hypothetical protein
MVQALLDGRKTQTRRVIKEVAGWGPHVTDVVRSFGNGRYFTCAADGSHMSGDFPCPYGKPGDLLYVREAWRTPESLDHLSPSEIAQRCKEAGYHGPWCPIVTVADNTAHNWSEEDGFRDDEPSGRFRQGMHMPRWASRITLRVTDVRVERVQDISEEDAGAEGAEPVLFLDEMCGGSEEKNRRGFHLLWNSINEARGFGWHKNPWVWVICFEVIRANVDDVLAGRVAA